MKNEYKYGRMVKYGFGTYPAVRKCPVCGKYVFPDAGNTFEDCPNCGWIDDAWQEEKPDEDSCQNIMSLNQAREAWARGEKVK